MKQIFCNLAAFVQKGSMPGQKLFEARSGKPTLYAIHSETKIAISTLIKYYNNQNTSFDKKVLEKLCDFLGVDVSELIVIK